MIKRELYMKRIRPFIGRDLVKVMTGIRRCGKSVMLELIKDEKWFEKIRNIEYLVKLHDRYTKKPCGKVPLNTWKKEVK